MAIVRPKPVACVALSQHRLSVLAGADDEVAVWRDLAVAEINDGPGVAIAGDRDLAK